MGLKAKQSIVTISVGHMFHDIYTAFLAPLLPLLIDKFHLSLFYAGFMELALRGPSLLNPIVGVIADRVSIRYCIIVAPAISALFMSLLGVAPYFPIVLILLLATGINATFYHVPSPVLIKKIAPKKTGAGMSLFMFGGECARTVGPLLITTAISLWGLEGSWRVMPIGMVASLLLYWKLKDLSIDTHTHSSDKTSGVRSTIKQYVPLLAIISFYVACRGGIKSGMVLYLAKYIANQDGSLWLQGIAISTVQFGGALGTLLAGFVSDRIGKYTTLLIAGIANPLCMWLFLFSPSSFMIPVLIVMGFFLFAPSPVMLALIQDVSSNRPALLNSLYMTLSFGINSAMVLLVGFVGDRIGLAQTYKFFSFVAILAIPVIFLMARLGPKSK